jgi:diguanylate cyclase (GGDEF)-like protein
MRQVGRRRDHLKMSAATKKLRLTPLFWYRWRRRDPLTGLLDHRKLQSDLVAAMRSSQQIAYILVDLDEFKKINDEYGHDIGDQVLRAVARALAGKCDRNRSCLGPYRQGGESFSVILSDMDAGLAVSFANAVRGSIEQVRIDGHPDLKVTARFAVVTATVDGIEDVEVLLLKAHGAVYCHPDEKKSNSVVHIAC